MVQLDGPDVNSEEYLNKEIEYTEFIQMERGTTVKDLIEIKKKQEIEWAREQGYGKCTFTDVRVFKIIGTTNRDLRAARNNLLKENDIISTNVIIELDIKFIKDVIDSSDGTITTGGGMGTGSIVATVVKGDLTGTGEVDVTSLSLMQQNVVEETELKGPYKEAADINNDKDIDVLDLSAIQEEIVNN